MFSQSNRELSNLMLIINGNMWNKKKDLVSGHIHLSGHRKFPTSKPKCSHLNNAAFCNLYLTAWRSRGTNINTVLPTRACPHRMEAMTWFYSSTETQTLMETPAAASQHRAVFASATPSEATHLCCLTRPQAKANEAVHLHVTWGYCRLRGCCLVFTGRTVTVNVSSVNTSLRILVELLLGCVSHCTVCLNMGSAGQLAVATAVLIRHNPGKLSGSLLEAQVEVLSQEAGMWFSLWEGPVAKGEGTQACHRGGDGGKRGVHGGVRAWSVRMKEMPWVSTWEDAKSYSKTPSLIIRQASRRPSLVSSGRDSMPTMQEAQVPFMVRKVNPTCHN